MLFFLVARQPAKLIKINEIKINLIILIPELINNFIKNVLQTTLIYNFNFITGN